MADAPRAFISHASEDKERFVVGFARKLRSRGVNAWLDKWELLPGDSLVDKIFEEGIKNAGAFIVVVSANSINKPWVREELDAGMVRKIERSCRLIPVILDQCEMPTTLKHLVWVRIHKLNEYENELTTIVNTIFGTTDKPPLGTAPKHAYESFVDYLPDLTKTDNLVFRSLGRRYLAENSKLLWLQPIYSELEELGLSNSEINESLTILDGRGYLKIDRAVGDHSEYHALELGSHGLDEFMRKELPEYNAIAMTIISKIVNESLPTNIEMQKATGISSAIVDHFLDVLELQGLVDLGRTIGCKHITSFSPELKRMLL